MLAPATAALLDGHRFLAAADGVRVRRWPHAALVELSAVGGGGWRHADLSPVWTAEADALFAHAISTRPADDIAPLLDWLADRWEHPVLTAAIGHLLRPSA